MAEKILIEYEVRDDGSLKQVRTMKKEIAGTEEAGKKAGRGMATFGTAVKLLGATIAAAGVGRFMRDSIQAAQEQQGIFQQLSVTLGNIGVNYNDVSRELDTMFSSLQMTTRFGDTDTAQVFGRLVQITGDYEAALSLLEPALDFAVAGQIDYNTAARLAGQAATGMTGTLSRYGVILDDSTKKQLASADAMGKAAIVADVLNSRFGGSARAEMQTYAGQVARLGNFWGDFQEAMGDIIVKASAAPGMFETLTNGMASLVDWAKNLGEVLVFVANLDWDIVLSNTIDRVVMAFELMVASILSNFAKLPGIGKVFQKAVQEIVQHAAELGESIDRHGTANFDKASDAAAAFRDEVSNLTVDGLPNFTKAAGDAAAALGDEKGTGSGAIAGGLGFVEAAALGVQQFDLLGRETNNLTTAINNSLTPAIMNGSLTISGLDTGIKNTSDSIEDLSNSTELISSSFSDLLGKGFMGEWDSFSDLWDSLWQDAAKSMTAILGGAFEDWMQGGMEGGIGGLFGSFEQGIKENRLGAGLGGAGMMIQGYQQGGTGGFLQGAMGGAMTGASIGSLFPGAGTAIGAVLGGIVGGIASLFGGSDDPAFRSSLGTGGFSIDSTSGGGFSSQQQSVFERNINQLVMATRGAYRDVLELFGDEGLFDVIGELQATDFGRTTQKPSEFAQWIGDVWLPEQFETMFKPAFRSGLRALGVDSDTMHQLFQELGRLPADARLNALADYVGALVDTNELLENMDWDSVLEAAGSTARDQFVEGMRQGLDRIDVLLAGWDNLTLIEQAQQAGQINDLMASARQAEIQYLRQIQQISDQINASIDAQIETLELGGMGEGGQADYAFEQFQAILEQLRTGGLSPDEVARLTQDAQRYAQMISGIFDSSGLMGGFRGSSAQDALFELFGGFTGQLEGDLVAQLLGSGGTGRDFLIGLLEMLRESSQGALDEAAEEARELNQEYLDRLQLQADALQHVNGVAEDLGESLDDLPDGIRDALDELGRFGGGLGRGTEALDQFAQKLLSLEGGPKSNIIISEKLGPLVELIEETIGDMDEGGGVY